MDTDFWSGVRLIVNGLADAAKRASYSLGFGAGGFGGALVAVDKFGISSPASILLSMSAFFILARVGKAVDDYVERASLERQTESIEEYIKTMSYNLPEAKRLLEEAKLLQKGLHQEVPRKVREKIKR